MSLDIEKVRELVASIVNSTLSDKEKENAVQVMEQALSEAHEKLQDVIGALKEKSDSLNEAVDKITLLEKELSDEKEKSEGLSSSLEEANKAASELQGLKDEAVEKVTSLEDKIVGLSATLAELQGSLDSIEKEKMLANRLSDLETAGVLYEGEARDIQEKRISSMNDEDFQTYKDELVSFKKSVLENATKKVTNKTNQPIVLNIERSSQTDASDQYKKFGETIAKNLADKRNRL